MTSSEERERQIEAELKTTDLSIEELQRKKRALLEERRAIRARTPGAPSATRPAPSPEAALEKALNLLEWTGFKKKDGEWAFLKDRQGNVVEWLESVPEFVEQVRSGKEVKVGRYRYRASDDKFLNRFID